MGPFCSKHRTTAPNIGRPPTKEPVNLADLVARQEVQKKANDLEVELKCITEELNNNKTSYSFFKNLQKFKDQAITCNLHAITKYIHLLTELDKFMPKDEFKMAKYLPKSQYAQVVVASYMILQISRKIPLFAAIPAEVQKMIAGFTVDAEFPEHCLNEVYNNCKRS